MDSRRQRRMFLKAKEKELQRRKRELEATAWKYEVVECLIRNPRGYVWDIRPSKYSNLYGDVTNLREVLKMLNVDLVIGRYEYDRTPEHLKAFFEAHHPSGYILRQEYIKCIYKRPQVYRKVKAHVPTPEGMSARTKIPFGGWRHTSKKWWKQISNQKYRSAVRQALHNGQELPLRKEVTNIWDLY